MASSSGWELRRRCVRNADGSIGLGLAVVVLAIILALGVGLVGAGLSAYAAASNAADAAVLAAAPLTFRPFGSIRGPSEEAAIFAARNGARLVSCQCAVDRSWNARTVRVVVARSIRLPAVGSITVRAASRATFEPLLLLDTG